MYNKGEVDVQPTVRTLKYYKYVHRTNYIQIKLIFNCLFEIDKVHFAGVGFLRREKV